MKTTIRIILFSAVSLFVLKSQAQSVTYTVRKNDAYDIKNFSLAIDPLFFDVNGQNGYVMGWGMRADYLMGKHLQFNFDFRNGFGTQGYNMNNKNTRNYTDFEGSIGLVLSHKTKTRNLPIVLSSSSYSSGGYTYTHTVSIKGGVPAQIRSMVILQGGVYIMGNTLKYTNLYDSLITFNDKKFTFKDSSTAFDKYNKSSYDKSFGACATTAIFGGFDFKNIHNLILDVDGYGARGNSIYRDFFIHGIFAPVLTIKDYTAGPATYNVSYKNVSHFGWRMGWIVRKPKDQGFSMKFEFGQRPGWKTEKKFGNWYGMFTYGLYIPLKLKPIAEQE